MGESRLTVRKMGESEVLGMVGSLAVSFMQSRRPLLVADKP